MRKFIGILLILMLVVVPVSASVIDDMNLWIDNGIGAVLKSIKTLSLPTYSTITVRCDEGATCSQSGENWAVSMNTLQNAQTLRMTLPSGTKQIVGDVEVTTQGTVTIEIRDKPPIETVPVYQTSMMYVMRTGVLWLQEEFPVPAYERSGVSSVITTNYDVQLIAPLGNSQILSKSYDYRNPSTIYLKDGAGNTATITPEHQVSGGYIVSIASVIFADNGYGTYQMYDKVDFLKYLEQVNYDVRMTLTPWAPPHTWVEFLGLMKTKGLRVWEDVPVVKSGTNNMILTYPAGSVGTRLQAIIPKKMALTLEVIQHYGEPEIVSTDLSPSTIAVGQGYQTLTVKVINKGSEDTISVSLPYINGMSVTNVINSLIIAKDRTGTFVFYLTPTLSASNPSLPIRILVTAHGSGIQTEKTIYSNVQVLPPDVKTQDMIITAYGTDKVAILSNAPLFVNGQQAGIGSVRVNKPLGTYMVTTNNNSNPTLYAPTPLEVVLSGGEPKEVKLYFSSTPQSDDYTWIFWLFVIGIFVAIIYVSGLWRHIPILLNPAIIIPLLYLIGFGIVIFLLWGLINAIANFKLF